MRLSTLLLLSLAAAGCANEGSLEPGTVELDLFAGPAICDDAACADPWTGEARSPLTITSWAVSSRESSEFDPRGLMVLSEIGLADGAWAELELDIPLDDATPRVRYVERDAAGAILFRPRRIRGEILLARDSCPCRDGTFELELATAGEDGVFDTPDDEVRRLSRGRFSRSGSSQCVPRRRGDVSSEPNVGRTGCGEVVGLSDGGVPGGYGDPYADDPYRRYDEASCQSSGCDGDSSSSGSGCDGDSSSSGGCDGDSSSSGGCDGDSSSSGGCDGDSGGGSDSGCEGDTSGSDSGCEGDSGGSDASCEGDSDASCDAGAARSGRGRRLRIPYQALVFPGLAWAFVWSRRRR